MQGGKREGAGRKAGSGNTKPVAMRLPMDVIEKLDRWNQETGKDKTQIVVEAIRKKRKP
jgi:predicted DNA-binding protein